MDSKKRVKSVSISVVIPALNEEKSLPNLLSDLNKQTYNNFDVFVVDGKSTDKTQSIVRKFSKENRKIRLLISDRRNVSHQRNMGAKESNSDWIVFMDADNRIPRTFMKKLSKELKKTNADILSTWVLPDSKLQKDEITAMIMNVFMEINKKAEAPQILESMFITRKGCFIKLKGFSPRVHWCEGRDLVKRANKKGFKYEFLKEPRYIYSLRRVRKTGAFKILQSMSLMEIEKILGKKLSKSKAKILYPMLGGKLYESKNTSFDLQKFISILFKEKMISKESLNLFRKSIKTWQSFFS